MAQADLLGVAKGRSGSTARLKGFMLFASHGAAFAQSPIPFQQVHIRRRCMTSNENPVLGANGWDGLGLSTTLAAGWSVGSVGDVLRCPKSRGPTRQEHFGLLAGVERCG